MSACVPLLTVPEVCEIVKLDETTIRRAIKRGDLPASKPCGQLRVHPDDLQAWIDSTRVQPSVQVPRAPAPRAPRAHTRPAAAGSFRSKLRNQEKAA